MWVWVCVGVCACEVRECVRACGREGEGMESERASRRASEREKERARAQMHDTILTGDACAKPSVCEE